MLHHDPYFRQRRQNRPVRRELLGQATLKENPHNFHGALHGRCQKCSALLGAGALRVPDGAMIRALFHVFGNKHAA